ncbi:MAG: hypothetical protein J6X55_16420 [Victivallales bacterium]|nr:hypothetical protein [Victivallales bacterium]
MLPESVMWRMTVDFNVDASTYANGYGWTSTYVIHAPLPSVGNRRAICEFTESGREVV